MMSAPVTVDLLKKVVGKFPKCSYSFAYGSAIFTQRNQKVGKMVDLIFVVDNPLEWHDENLKKNPSHYSSLKFFGARGISRVQENFAAGVYFNPYVNIGGILLKYGVISTASALDDLQNWSHIYFSGRLHKPVREITPPSTSALVNAIKGNHEAALRAALLLLPRYSTKFELYHTISELSYKGDLRMWLGENPNKVLNIVSTAIPEFDKIYYPLLDQVKAFVTFDTYDRLIQDTHHEAVFFHLMKLPHPIQRLLIRKAGRDPVTGDVEDILSELSCLPHTGQFLRKAISDVVWKSSLLQTTQGILSAGVVKSVKYGLEKLKKKTQGKREEKLVSTRKLTQQEKEELEALKKKRRESHIKAIQSVIKKTVEPRTGREFLDSGNDRDRPVTYQDLNTPFEDSEDRSFLKSLTQNLPTSGFGLSTLKKEKIDQDISCDSEETQILPSTESLGVLAPKKQEKTSRKSFLSSSKESTT